MAHQVGPVVSIPQLSWFTFSSTDWGQHEGKDGGFYFFCTLSQGLILTEATQQCRFPG